VRDRLPIHVVRKGGADRRSGRPFKISREFGFSVHSHQTRNLPDEQVVVVDTVRVLTPERSLLDFAAQATASEIGKALTQGEREGSLCWETLEKVVENSHGYRGAGLLRREMERFQPASVDAESDPEEDFLRMISRQGLPDPLVNVWLDPYRVDFLWPQLMLIVELDPWGTHRGRRSFHGDRRKSIELETRGFRVIRITADDLYLHEERTARELETIMKAQARILERNL